MVGEKWSPMRWRKGRNGSRAAVMVCGVGWVMAKEISEAKTKGLFELEDSVKKEGEGVFGEILLQCLITDSVAKIMLKIIVTYWVGNGRACL